MTLPRFRLARLCGPPKRNVGCSNMAVQCIFERINVVPTIPKELHWRTIKVMFLDDRATTASMGHGFWYVVW